MNGSAAAKIRAHDPEDGMALSLSILWSRAEALYRKNDLDGLLDLRRANPRYLQDTRLAFFLFAALARMNRIDDVEVLYRELIQQNTNNTAIIYRLMCHQRIIRNSARFHDLMVDYAQAAYQHGRDQWTWQDLYSSLRNLGGRGVSCALDSVVNGFQHHDATNGSQQNGLLARLRIAEEFLMFYESTRLLHGFAIRFKRVPLWDVEDDMFWECIVNRQSAGEELTKLTAQGPNVVILLHSPFNKLILRIFRRYSTNSRTIAKSLYKSDVDDGHMLLFQADKSSRLAVFVKAFKHLSNAKGSVMLAPDGATGGEAVRGMILGAPLRLFNGAPHLARATSAKTILIHPDFREDGIYINVVKLDSIDADVSQADFDIQWRTKFCSVLEKLYLRQNAIMSIPPAFVTSL